MNTTHSYSCPTCGVPVHLGDKFCSQCRAPLAWPDSAPQTMVLTLISDEAEESRTPYPTAFVSSRPAGKAKQGDQLFYYLLCAIPALLAVVAMMVAGHSNQAATPPDAGSPPPIAAGQQLAPAPTMSADQRRQADEQRNVLLAQQRQQALEYDEKLRLQDADDYAAAHPLEVVDGSVHATPGAQGVVVEGAIRNNTRSPFTQAIVTIAFFDFLNHPLGTAVTQVQGVPAQSVEGFRCIVTDPHAARFAVQDVTGSQESTVVLQGQ